MCAGHCDLLLTNKILYILIPWSVMLDLLASHLSGFSEQAAIVGWLRWQEIENGP